MPFICEHTYGTCSSPAVVSMAGSTWAALISFIMQAPAATAAASSPRRISSTTASASASPASRSRRKTAPPWKNNCPTVNFTGANRMNFTPFPNALPARRPPLIKQRRAGWSWKKFAVVRYSSQAAARRNLSLTSINAA